MTGEKMILAGYTDSTYSTPTGFVCQVQVNPESYSLDQSITLNTKQAPGSAATASAFGHLNPRKLSFEVIFDATGAMDAPQQQPKPPLLVKTGILPTFTAFKNTVCKYIGDSHRSPYVHITWGSLIFRCQLESFNASFKLFSGDGVPLRATVKVAFQEAIDDYKGVLEANALSADLTHLRTVQAGDTLPLLCQRIYGNPALYPQVARANGLSNLRTLRVGQQLAFPPLVPASAR